MTIHVVGAGMAGLAAAVRAAEAGRAVRLYEAAGQAGGRCRSLDDPLLGCRLDNGNHLLLSGNRSTLAHLDAIGARDALIGPVGATFPFLDLAAGRQWRIGLNRGPLPLWPFIAARRVPRTVPADYLVLARLLMARAGQTVGDIVPEDHPLYRTLIAPLATAALNTAPGEGAAIVLRRMLVETLLRGGGASRPLVARHGLDDAFVAPALTWLRGRGVVPRFNERLRALGFVGGRLAALGFAGGAVALAPDDAVVLAVPPSAAADLVPDLRTPEESRAILNAHFRLPSAPTVGWAPFVGLIGGTAEWVFVRGDVVSVTVSAADTLIDEPAETLAAVLWRDVARALAIAGAMPPCRVIKERRATIAQTPGSIRRRPPATTAWPNLFLAGDWIDTGLPATIESAIRSGHRAAELALGATARDR